MRRFSPSLAIIPFLIALSACSSTESQPAEPKPMSGKVPTSLKQSLTANLKAAGLGAKVIDVHPTELQGIYWVTLDGLPAVFTTADGKYIIQGDVIRLDQNKIEDVGAPLMQAEAARLLGSVDKKDMITFSPAGTPKAVAYVFTDADCGYCRKLHSEINDITAKGIEIRYLAWPRSPQSMPDMNAVWCSEDRNAALTQAKSGIRVQAPNCQNPVMAQRQIGMQIGVNGTPAIYSPSGEYLGGYLPAAELAKKLGL